MKALFIAAKIHHMNYRHLFHAGNFSDVHKHAILCVLLQAFVDKSKPFNFIDTHAGVGLYDLNSEEAKRNPEFEFGIMKLLKYKVHDVDLKKYLAIVTPYLEKKQYPGSPLIAQHILPEINQLVLNEYHPEDAKALKKLFEAFKNCHCHARNAYEFLPAILPPTPRRALILIDPPYESKTEFDDLCTLIEKSHHKFSEGCYVIWYPIKEGQHLALTHTILKKFTAEKCVISEVTVKHPRMVAGIRGSGLLIINPPYPTDEKIAKLTEELNTLLL